MLRVDNVFHRYNLASGYFSSSLKHVYAVNGVSLSISPGEIYGLVGESGSGKTTLASMLVGLVPVDIGTIVLENGKGRQWSPYVSKEKKEYRQQVRYVFQDPATSLNSRLSVRTILYDSIRYTSRWEGKNKANKEIASLFDLLTLEESFLERSPIALSGGQRKRISLARALLTRPKLIICDEIASSLDSTIRKQILEIILTLRKTYGISILFIGHDLSNVLYVADRIGVMYRGVLVEEGSAEQISFNHRHQYTRRLYESVPKMLKSPKVVPIDTTQFDPTEDMAAYEQALESGTREEKRVDFGNGHTISHRYNSAY